jgi:hypothetical protein
MSSLIATHDITNDIMGGRRTFHVNAKGPPLATLSMGQIVKSSRLTGHETISLPGYDHTGDRM